MSFLTKLGIGKSKKSNPPLAENAQIVPSISPPDTEAQGPNEQQKERMIIRVTLAGKKLGAVLDSDWFIAIPGLGYYGSYLRSENGRFILSWSTPDPFDPEGEPGKYLLIDGDKIILRGRLKEPKDGKVSDRGIFIINDSMFQGDRVGTFYAFDANGQKLIQRKFNAELWENGISRGGQFAVCHTVTIVGKGVDYLYFFDLGKRELIWKRELEMGPPHKFGFDVEKEILIVFFSNDVTYRYAFNGTFLDSEKWKKDQSEKWHKEPESPYESRYGYGLYALATEKLAELGDKEVDISSCDEVISLMKQAIEKGVSENYQAMIHRRLGELYQKHGKIAEAILHYENAISLYPKIGVKKQLKSLKETFQNPRGET